MLLFRPVLHTPFMPVLLTPSCFCSGLCCRHLSCPCCRHLHACVAHIFHASVADTFHAPVADTLMPVLQTLMPVLHTFHACVAYLSCPCCRHLDACGRADHAPGRCGCLPAHRCHVHWHTSVTCFYRPASRASECANRGLIFVLPPPHSFTCLDQSLRPNSA